MFKKTVALILAVLTLIPVAMISVSAKTNSEFDLGFAVATDLHYVHPLEDANARWSDTAELTFGSSSAMQNESGFIIDEFLRQCAENDECEYVFICGDIATYSRERGNDQKEVAEKFKVFEKATGKQVYVINGNHDNGAGSQVDSAKFREIYYELGYDKAFSVDESCCSYATELNDKYVLIALDSFDERYMLANGVDSARLKWVKEQADYAKKNGKYPIVIMHHNLLEHQPLETILNDKYIVSFPETVASLFAEWGIKLVFSGHTHINDVASYTTPTGKTVYDFCNAALNSYPLNYKTFKLTDEKISYETKSIEMIDYAALSSVVKTGYTERQTQLLKTDFKQFAKEYNVGNVLSLVTNGISPELIGIDGDSALYAPVKKITDALAILLKKPLYGENSISSQAVRYSIDIPKTNYNDMSELITEIYCDVVSGDRNYEFDGPEIKIILAVVETAINMGLSEESDGKLRSIADGINNVTRAKISVNAVSAVEYLALAVVGPFLYEYINSTDGLNNLCGELDGYGVKTGISNTFDSLSMLVNKLATYFEIIATMLKKSFGALLGIA